MTKSFIFGFAHRKNRDGTYDAICMKCFMTVGKSFWEVDLGKMEQAHRCDDRIEIEEGQFEIPPPADAKFGT